MILRSRQIYLLLTLVLIAVVALSSFWEFYLEDLVVPHIYVYYHPEPTYERLEYIAVSLIFAAIALIVPGQLAIHSTRANERTMKELSRAHAELESRVQQRTAELANANRELVLALERQREAEEALRRSEKNLRNLSSGLLVLQEDEKHLISNELHESVTQMLSALKFRIEHILSQYDHGNGEMANDMRTSVLPAIQDAIDDVRKIYMDLRPTILDDLGLIATINWPSGEFRKNHPHIRVASEIGVVEREIPDYLKVVIFRVLQQGLDNIARHSQASEAHFTLERHDHTLDLVLRDNGIGFDMTEAQSVDGTYHGVGLGSMRTRVEQTMGTFQINTGTGAGVTIQASWHVRNGQAA